MSREFDDRKPANGQSSPKHRPGGLIDIEFIAQLGVLVSARQFPRVLQVTGTLRQLHELMAIGWLSPEEEKILRETARRLSRQRMMTSLERAETAAEEDTTSAAAIFNRKMREYSRPLP